MEWYKLEVKDIERKLHVFSEKGLNDKQVEQRRKQFGYNKIQDMKRQPLWVLFMKQFQDFMVIVLLAATLIAGMLGEYIDAIAIMIIVVLNGCMGFFQEQKAEKSLERLKELAAPVIRVLRNGEWRTIPSEEAVVGDIIKITSGDRVPADIRIVNASGLETEESALTGESLPVEKTDIALQEEGQLNIQDQRNMAFKGTLVTKGNANGIVVHTGMQTEIGKIASLMVRVGKIMTPLELKLVQLGKVLIFIVFLLTALTVGIGIYHGHPTYDMFLAGVSLAVAVIPEGLPAIVTVALSLGVQRMIKRKAIVRKLSAVETLGCATVICTDKTGTITENKMTVKEVFINGSRLKVTGEGNSAKGSFVSNRSKVDRSYPNLEAMLTYAMVCNEAQLQVKKGKYVVDGDPTDGALLIAARKLGLSYQLKEKYTMIKQIPFDSTRKRMSVVIEDENKRKFLITKGAPEMILPRCTFQLDLSGRKRLYDTREIDKQVNEMTEKALRVIAISMRPLQSEESLTSLELEKNLTFIGLFGMKDPPRKEVKKAIQDCRNAGIKTVMITGDHKKTAEAIATEIGLHSKEGLIVEGSELNGMDVDTLASIIHRVTVFTRVTPEQKLKIVKAFQQQGHIVAMTGDGINDAPAIKASNIGVSMGISGTDVTKEASSIILMDDNFNTIKEAIREGRNIYENIRKFIRYLLASNVGEIFVMLVAMMMAMPLPLVPVQILWVNLVTDGLPAMALGLDSPEENVMRRQPRDPKENIFARGLGFKIISRGLLIGLVTLIAFIIAYDHNPANLVYAQTVAFSTLVVAQLIHVFDCRSEQGIFKRNPFQNMYLIFAVISSMLLLLVVLYVENLQPIFHTTYLNMRDWSLIIVLSLIPTILFSMNPFNRNNNKSN